MQVIENINGYIVECERTIQDETGREEKVNIYYKVNASSPQNAYRLMQSYIEGMEGISIKGITKEYPNQPFVGIMM